MGQIESKNFDYFASNWTKVQLDKGGNVHDSQVFLGYVMGIHDTWNGVLYDVPKSIAPKKIVTRMLARAVNSKKSLPHKKVIESLSLLYPIKGKSLPPSKRFRLYKESLVLFIEEWFINSDASKLPDGVSGSVIAYVVGFVQGVHDCVNGQLFDVPQGKTLGQILTPVYVYRNKFEDIEHGALIVVHALKLAYPKQ